MNDETALLRAKFSDLIAWERSKRRENILLAALAYAFIVALVFLPARRFLPAGVSPLSAPIFFFAVLAAAHFWRRRWRAKDSLTALAALDRALGLDERALTAAEIIHRGAPSPVELYVLHEAGEKLKAADVRSLFKRRWSWQALSAPALIVLWLALLWLGVGADFGAAGSKGGLAEKVKDYSRELEEKAEAQSLKESLKTARALKALADERLSGKASEEKFQQNLAGMEKRIDALPPAPAGDFDFGGYTREEAAALKAELEAAKSRLRSAPGGGEKDLRLESLPRLSEAIQRSGGAMENMGPGELERWLDRLEQQIAGELERRSLADVRQFLSLILGGRDSGDASSQAEIEGHGRQDGARDQDRSAGKGKLPGDQPGVKLQGGQPPAPSAGAAARIPGVVGEGAGSGVTWRAEAKAGASKVPEEEAPASYRRQMEEELAAEKIPPALKETVKKYFLSLDDKNKRQ
ncbi:MAG TPA: hypothetical protein VL754_12000 [Verrucomicrobiae bacterium]|nr:hypothetical protein [Verrucomicrobiae bacterium]